MTYQNKKNILIVNDSPDQLEMFRVLFQQAGYNVSTAAGGYRAFEKAQARLPDLLISDVMMPDGDGIELCRMIRGDEKLRTLPILLVSGISKDVRSVVEGLEVGADDYVKIPVDPLHLIARAARLLERKQMEDFLRDSESYYRSLIENVSDIVTVLTLDGKILFESPSIEAILGVPPGDMIGKSAFDFVHPDDRQRAMNYFYEALSDNGIAKPIEYRFRGRNGGWRMLESLGKVISHPTNGVVAVVNSRDITERKEAERALRDSEERFRAQYKGFPLPTYTWRKVEDDFVLSDYNDAADQETHGKVANLLGIRGIDLYEKKELLECMHRCYNERTVIRREDHYRYVTTGEQKYLDLSFVFVPPDIVMVHTRDITGEKNAEQARRDSEEKFRKVLENSRDVIYQVNLETNSFDYMSPAALELSGYYPEEYLNGGADFGNSLVHPDDLPTLKQHAKLMRRESNPEEVNHTLEYRLKTRHRGYRWISENRNVIRGDEGRAIGIIAVARDITDQKQTQEALRRSELHLRNILENEPECVKVLGLSGEVVDMNPAGLAAIEADSLEQIKGRPIAEQIVAPEHYEAFCALNKNVLAGNSGTLEFEIIGLKGTRRWMETHAVPLRDENGRVTSLLAITRDFTERKKAELALNDANERAIREYEHLLDRIARLSESLGTARDLLAIYRELYDFATLSVPCNGFFIALFDAERNQRIPAYVCTDGVEGDVSDLPPMEMTGSPNSRAVSTGKIVVENDFQSAMSGKPVVNIGLDRDPRLPQSCLVVPMAVMGRIVGAVEVQSVELGAYQSEHATAMRMAANLAANAIENVRLIEQERKSAEQLRQSQKLESVGRLAGGIAHDFNNMLTAINGYSELILRRLQPDDPLRLHVEEIKKAGDRSASLTHQLLAFSRQQVLQLKVFDLNETVIDTTKMLRRLIGEDVQLNTILHPTLGCVEADPGQLSQVLINLAVNARDAMPNGGTLTIETRNVYLDEEFAADHVPTQPGPYVHLSVRDTGIGMDAETQQHIFEPFFTTKEVGKGTGLGLSMVYGTVKQSGGYIWVESEKDEGTTFHIYLPRVDKPAEEGGDGPLREIPKGTETILIVEDEEMVRSLTRQMLEEWGYRVIEASNGAEALEVCRQLGTSIDLILTDVVMPLMGGRELAEKLSRICPRMRILFMSGYTDDAVIRHQVVTADTNFIQKPFTFETLGNKIREFLDAPDKKEH